MGTIVAAVLALLCAVAAALLTSGYLQRQARAARQGGAMVPVVVSAADLSFGKSLQRGDLRIALYPQASVPKGAVAVVDSLVGQTTKVFLTQNEPVLVSKLSSIGGGLSLLIAPDMRAVSVKVDKVSGVSGFVLPGDRVDVIAVAKPTYAAGDARSRIVLQNVEVLAAGTDVEQRGTEPLTVQAVTLLVDQVGAETLALAENEGKIHLALRNPNDTHVTGEAKGLSKSELLAVRTPEEATPRVAKPAPPARAAVAESRPAAPRADTLTIVRGTDASKEATAIRTQPKEGSASDAGL